MDWKNCNREERENLKKLKEAEEKQLNLSPYETVIYFYHNLANAYQYTPAEIDNTEIETMFEMLYVASIVRGEEEKPKKKYIDEIMP